MVSSARGRLRRFGLQNQPDRGLVDPNLGEPVRYLFLCNGTLAHPDHLFAKPLRDICADLSILNAEGKAASHTYRFRHTLGAQLVEKGSVRSGPAILSPGGGGGRQGHLQGGKHGGRLSQAFQDTPPAITEGSVR